MPSSLKLWYAIATPAEVLLRSQTLRVPLHSGYREHPQNSPRGPFRFTIGEPHFGQRMREEG